VYQEDGGPPDFALANRDEMKSGRAPASPQRMRSPEEAAAVGNSLFGNGGAAIDPAASVVANASAAQIGELFSYTVADVDLPRQSSAMIPIITDPIEVERVSIYNQSVLARYALSGARVKNTTEKHLLQGPITVFQEGGYSGDAQINNVAPGDTRLISYGIDLQTLVDIADGPGSTDVLAGRIVSGVLELTYKNVASRTYSITNKSDRARTVVIEHPRMPGYEITGETKPVETTDQLYRFETRLDAGAAGKLTAQSERVYGQRLALLETAEPQLVALTRGGTLPEPLRDAIAEVLRRRADLARLEVQVAQQNTQIESITAEQDRIRENLRTVERNSEYSGRLMKKLNEQETAIEAAQKRVADLTSEITDRRRDFERFVSGLNIQ
jgi:uncharacterized coiled-coil protein SlyX